MDSAVECSCSGDPVTLGRILPAVALAFGVTVNDIRGNRRTQTVADARAAAMYLMRHRMARSYPDIGAAFGRHHTTVIDAVRRVDAWENPNDNLANYANWCKLRSASRLLGPTCGR